MASRINFSILPLAQFGDARLDYVQSGCGIMLLKAHFFTQSAMKMDRSIFKAILLTF